MLDEHMFWLKFVFQPGAQVKFDADLKDKFDHVIKSTLKAINIANSR